MKKVLGILAAIGATALLAAGLWTAIKARAGESPEPFAEPFVAGPTTGEG